MSFVPRSRLIPGGLPFRTGLVPVSFMSALYINLSHAQCFSAWRFAGPSRRATALPVEPLHLCLVEQVVPATLFRGQLAGIDVLPDPNRADFEDGGCFRCRNQTHE